MKNWKVLNSSRFTVHSSQSQIISALLDNRGIKEDQEIHNFMNPILADVTLESVGINLQAVKKTIERIKRAISKNEDIIIYGDYDVDGICGTAILWETIYSIYKQKNVHPYIPHRIDEGYGLSVAGISNLQSQISNIKLIITVDNGIVANKAVDFANSQGIDVIITDHHVKGDTLPDAIAIIHTTQLCGTGVAYLLAQEIASSFSLPRNDNTLELVALATVADLVPLQKHNRTLLTYGLRALRKTKRPGLVSLLTDAKINKTEIDTYHIGHIIAPRLNATGRISHAMDALRLVCTTDPIRGSTLSALLSKVNQERQNLTFESAKHAIEQARSQESASFASQDGQGASSLILVADVSYDQGVIGLIASKLVEEFYKPSIAVSVGEAVSKGSARSINGVNIIELIRSVPEYLKEAGGHPMAAGFSIETKNLENFKNALLKKAKEIDKTLFERTLKVDMELGFDLISLELYKEIQKLSPFGMGNPAPVFMTKGVTVVSINMVGKNKEHAQIMFEKDATFFKGILFRCDKDLKIRQLVDIAYTIEKNEWKEKVIVELRIKDLKVN